MVINNYRLYPNTTVKMFLDNILDDYCSLDDHHKLEAQIFFKKCLNSGYEIFNNYHRINMVFTAIKLGIIHSYDVILLPFFDPYMKINNKYLYVHLLELNKHKDYDDFGNARNYIQCLQYLVNYKINFYNIEVMKNIVITAKTNFLTYDSMYLVTYLCNLLDVNVVREYLEILANDDTIYDYIQKFILELLSKIRLYIENH